MRKEGALMVANRELSEKQKEKVEKEINYMFYELYTKRMSAEAAQELAKATYEKVKTSTNLKRTLKQRRRQEPTRMDLRRYSRRSGNHKNYNRFLTGRKSGKSAQNNQRKLDYCFLHEDIW